MLGVCSQPLYPSWGIRTMTPLSSGLESPADTSHYVNPQRYQAGHGIITGVIQVSQPSLAQEQGRGGEQIRRGK